MQHRLYSRSPHRRGTSGPAAEYAGARRMVALAQPAEQRTVDPQVTGSTPVGHPISTRERLANTCQIWSLLACEMAARIAPPLARLRRVHDRRIARIGRRRAASTIDGSLISLTSRSQAPVRARLRMTSSAECLTLANVSTVSTTTNQCFTAITAVAGTSPGGNFRLHRYPGCRPPVGAECAVAEAAGWRWGCRHDRPSDGVHARVLAPRRDCPVGDGWGHRTSGSRLCTISV
jgi:hypothetical protein